MNLFNSIEEYKPEYVFLKYGIENEDNERFIDLDGCKQALYFIFGKKIKKSFIKEILTYNKSNKITIPYSISLPTFKYVYAFIKNNKELNQTSDLDMILLIYNYTNSFQKIDHKNYENKSHFINLDNFTSVVKRHFPYLKESYIEEIFLFIDDDKDGLIKITDLEKFVNNSL